MAEGALVIHTEETEDGARLIAEGPAEAVEFCFLLIVGTMMNQEGVSVSGSDPDSIDVTP